MLHWVLRALKTKPHSIVLGRSLKAPLSLPPSDELRMRHKIRRTPSNSESFAELGSHCRAMRPPNSSFALQRYLLSSTENSRAGSSSIAFKPYLFPSHSSFVPFITVFPLPAANIGVATCSLRLLLKLVLVKRNQSTNRLNIWLYNE